MMPEELLELLISIAEEDAINARLYRLFNVNKGYDSDVVRSIVLAGINEHYFGEEAIDGQVVSYKDII